MDGEFNFFFFLNIYKINYYFLLIIIKISINIFLNKLKCVNVTFYFLKNYRNDLLLYSDFRFFVK